jgi:hypothetical protein
MHLAQPFSAEKIDFKGIGTFSGSSK